MVSLTHWGRVTHICINKVTIIGSENGLSPGQWQAIVWTNAGILLIGPLGTNFNDILIKIQTFSFRKRHLKMSSDKWRPFSLGLNVLSTQLFPSSPPELAEYLDEGGLQHKQYLATWASSEEATYTQGLAQTIPSSKNVFYFNSLAPGIFEWHFRYLIFQLISVINAWSISCELAHRWMSLDLTLLMISLHWFR